MAFVVAAAPAVFDVVAVAPGQGWDVRITGRSMSNGWPVYADCDVCGLRLKADLARMAQPAI